MHDDVMLDANDAGWCVVTRTRDVIRGALTRREQESVDALYNHVRVWRGRVDLAAVHEGNFVRVQSCSHGDRALTVRLRPEVAGPVVAGLARLACFLRAQGQANNAVVLPTIAPCGDVTATTP